MERPIIENILIPNFFIFNSLAYAIKKSSVCLVWKKANSVPESHNTHSGGLGSSVRSTVRALSLKLLYAANCYSHVDTLIL